MDKKFWKGLAFGIPISLLMWLLIIKICFGATYYIKNGGSDAADGLSDGNAWETISKVNGSSFSAGDFVLFKKGSTWREQLTVPSSGSAGNPITFGAYGSGAQPIINGANLITGFAAATVDWATTFSIVPSSPGNGTESRERRNTLGAASLSNSGTSIRVTFKGGAVDGTLGGASIGEGSGATGDYSAAPTRITFNGGASTYAFSANEVFLSDEIVFTLDETKDYLLHIHYPNPYSYVIYSGGASSQHYLNAAASDDTMVADISGYTVNAYWTGVTKVEVKTTLSNVWKATLTTEPSQVYFDQVRGTKVASAALCNEVGKWYWAANVLYIYSASDPATLYIAPGVEASIRTKTIYSASKNYVTIQDLECKYANEVTTGGSVHVNVGTSVILSNLTVHDNDGKAGIRIYGSGDGKMVQDCMVYNQRYSVFLAHQPDGTGIAIDGTGGTYVVTRNTVYSNVAGIYLGFAGVDAGNNWTISHNTVYSNGMVGIGAFGDGTKPNNAIIEYNTVYSNGALDADWYGIDLLQMGDNNIVRYNLVYDNIYVDIDAGGIRFDGSTGTPALWGTGNKMYYNLIYNEWRGIHAFRLVGGGIVYNNMVYNTTYDGIVVDDSASNDGVLVKNNIISIAGRRLIWWEGPVNSILANNLYYDTDYTNKFFNGTSYSTLALWQAGSSQDTNSVAADPLFVSTTDFHLQSTSPAINAGVDVGLTTDYDGNSVPRGSGFDIGAYEFLSGSTLFGVTFGSGVGFQ